MQVYLKRLRDIIANDSFKMSFSILIAYFLIFILLEILSATFVIEQTYQPVPTDQDSIMISHHNSNTDCSNTFQKKLRAALNQHLSLAMTCK